jgi:hypothetical protein
MQIDPYFIENNSPENTQDPNESLEMPKNPEPNPHESNPATGVALGFEIALAGGALIVSGRHMKK